MTWTRHSERYYEVVICKEKMITLESMGFTVELRDHEEKFGKKWARIYMEMNEFYHKHKRVAHYY